VGRLQWSELWGWKKKRSKAERMRWRRKTTGSAGVPAPNIVEEDSEEKDLEKPADEE
jgi:hypothetical protein